MPLPTQESKKTSNHTLLDQGDIRTTKAPAAGSTLATTTIDLEGSVTLELCSRELSIAGQTIPQYWVDKRTLVARNGTVGKNFQPIVDHLHHVALPFDCIEGDAVETHLLATLLPEVRQDAAQAIFPDAGLKKRSTKSEDEFLKQLDEMLFTSRHDRLKLIEFHEQSRNAVGFPTLSGEERSLYTSWCEELFDGLDKIWLHDLPGAVGRLKSRWAVWRKKFGRRSHSHLQKTVLNVLSYESKAAFHQCYSAAWATLLPQLAGEVTSAEVFTNFHGLWHLDQRSSIPGNHQDLHLLHGLVLGLHPAFSMLISTPTGRELIGEAVIDTSDIAAQERFFHAALVSIFLYESERATYNSSRRNI